MTNKFYRSYTFETRTLYPNMNFILNFLPIYVMLAVHDFQVVVCTNHVCFLHRFKGAVNTRAIANRHHIRGRNATSISFEGLVRTDHGRTDMLNSVFKKATRRSVLVEYCDKLLNVVENYTVEYGVQVIQDHRNWYTSKNTYRFCISLLLSLYSYILFFEI